MMINQAVVDDDRRMMNWEVATQFTDEIRKVEGIFFKTKIQKINK